VLHLDDVTAGRVHIDGNRRPAPSAEQLPDRHPGLLALEVPQRHVDARDGVVQHGAVPPVSADLQAVPQVGHVGGITADQLRSEVVAHGGRHRLRSLREGRAPQTVEAGLGGEHLDHDEGEAFRRRQENLDVGDPGARAGAFLLPRRHRTWILARTSAHGDRRLPRADVLIGPLLTRGHRCAFPCLVSTSAPVSSNGRRRTELPTERLAPQLLAIFPFFMMFLITSITTLRERVGGTLERLMTLPIGSWACSPATPWHSAWPRSPR